VDSTIIKLINNPRLGKPLRGKLAGKWSLRVGKYRIIYIIDDKEESVLLFNVRERRVVYR
jgi:mRNA interferase RelE/StbE